jgi:hypothetical protein
MDHIMNKPKAALCELDQQKNMELLKDALRDLIKAVREQQEQDYYGQVGDRGKRTAGQCSF